LTAVMGEGKREKGTPDSPTSLAIIEGEADGRRSSPTRRTRTKDEAIVAIVEAVEEGGGEISMKLSSFRDERELTLKGGGAEEGGGKELGEERTGRRGALAGENSRQSVILVWGGGS